MDQQKSQIDTGIELAEDVQVEVTIRPRNLASYIGQSKVKERIEIEIQAARNSGKALDHVLLYGPPGLGKTSLGYIIAYELGVGLKISSGPLLIRKADLVEILVSLEEGDVLFIDEIHRLIPALAEILYTAMEDYRIDLVVDGHIVQKKLKHFTLIAATTRAGLLPAPLRSRFGIEFHLDFYSPEELADIVRQSAGIENIDVDDDGALEIARRSRGTPRIANRLLRRTRAFAQVRAQGNITQAIAKDALQMLGIDARGLNEVDRKLMHFIMDQHSGGPVGLPTLAASLSEEEDVIADMHEPFLLRLGLLKLTPRGRVATEAAYKYFRTEPSSVQQETNLAPIRAEKVPTSNRLSLEEFGAQLLLTEDLDPVYVTLARASLPTEILHPFFLGYWFFYHVGVAAQLSEYKGGQFFEKAIVLAPNGKGTPRGAERRHFRGEDCLKSLDYFYTTYGDPNYAVSDLIQNCAGKNVSDVLRFVKRWPEFGPWIGFKIADMLERVANVPITFHKEALQLYKAPTEGAKVWCAHEGRNFDELGISGVVTILEGKFTSFKAPPRYDRPVGVAEIETILCKWHSHLNGHYPVGKDSREILEHLSGWGTLAESLKQHVPSVGTDGTAPRAHRLGRSAKQNR